MARKRAARTTFWVVTSRNAAATITAARMAKTMFWATTAGTLAPVPARLLLLLDRPGLQRRRIRDGDHPLAEPVLVVQEVGDARLGVLVLRRPEQGVEGADLDADAAVHAEGVVDVEAVEGVDRPRLAPLTTGRALLLVSLDVDAPVRALPGTEHADGAVLLLEGDDAPGARGEILLLVRVLHRHRALGPRVDHGLEGDPKTLGQTRQLRHRQQLQRKG